MAKMTQRVQVPPDMVTDREQQLGERYLPLYGDVVDSRISYGHFIDFLFNQRRIVNNRVTKVFDYLIRQMNENEIESLANALHQLDRNIDIEKTVETLKSRAPEKDYQEIIESMYRDLQYFWRKKKTKIQIGEIFSTVINYISTDELIELTKEIVDSE